jgi:hypothetical protein
MEKPAGIHTQLPWAAKSAFFALPYLLLVMLNIVASPAPSPPPFHNVLFICMNYLRI